MNLDEALKQFDVVDANLTKLERVWARMEALIPEGIAFVERGPEGRAYRELQRAHAELVKGLPAIDGWQLEAGPLDLDEIAQCRLDAHEIDEPSAMASIERAVVRPGEEIEEYRSRFTRRRRPGLC